MNPNFDRFSEAKDTDLDPVDFDRREEIAEAKADADRDREIEREADLKENGNP